MRNISIALKGIIAFTKLGLAMFMFRNDKESMIKVGKDFKNFFQDVGGIYIKFGQILSLRKDLLPSEVCAELRELLDRVSPLDSQISKQIIEEQLKGPLSANYVEFEETPLASASLGQVHKARLHSGEQVVIKILRPGIEILVENDTSLLKLIGRIVDFLPILNLKVYPIIMEFTEWIWEEVDYRNEAMNLKEFAKHKSDTLPVFGIPLKNNVPYVYEELTTQRVITMEFINGRTINELMHAQEDKNSTAYQQIIAEGYDYEKISRMFNLVAMKQIFLDGYFNADPHPANIIVTPDDTIYYIDFGLIGRLNRRDRIANFRLGRALGLLDKETAFHAINELLDIDNIKDEIILRKAIDRLVDDMRSAQVKGEINYAQTSSKAMFNLFFIINKHNIQVPPHISKALRAVVTADGITAALNPDMDMDIVSDDLQKVALAATYQELKTSLQDKKTMQRLMLKAVAALETNIFLD